MGAPTGAASAGPVALTTTGQDLVTDIDEVNEAGLAMSFTLSATVAAGPVSGAREFTITMTTDA
jgi:hypothetical protein